VQLLLLCAVLESNHTRAASLRALPPLSRPSCSNPHTPCCALPALLIKSLADQPAADSYNALEEPIAASTLQMWTADTTVRE